jgi:hypothetical protein
VKSIWKGWHTRKMNKNKYFWMLNLIKTNYEINCLLIVKFVGTSVFSFFKKNFDWDEWDTKLILIIKL